MGCGNAKLHGQQIAYQKDFLGTCWNSAEPLEADAYIPSRWMGISRRTMEVHTSSHCFNIQTLMTEHTSTEEADQLRHGAERGPMDPRQGGGLVGGTGGMAGSLGHTSEGLLGSVVDPEAVALPAKTTIRDTTHTCIVSEHPTRGDSSMGPSTMQRTASCGSLSQQGDGGLSSANVISIAGSLAGTATTTAPGKARRGSDPRAIRNIVKSTNEMDRMVHNAHPYLMIHDLSIYGGVVFACAPRHRLYNRIALVPDPSPVWNVVDPGWPSTSNLDGAGMGVGNGSMGESPAIVQLSDVSPQQLRFVERVNRGARSDPNHLQQLEEGRGGGFYDAASGLVTDDPLAINNNYPVEDRDVPMPASYRPSVGSEQQRPKGYKEALKAAQTVIIGSITAGELLALPPNAEVCLGGWLYVSLEDEQERLRRALATFDSRLQKRMGREEKARQAREQAQRAEEEHLARARERRRMRQSRSLGRSVDTREGSLPRRPDDRDTTASVLVSSTSATAAPLPVPAAAVDAVQIDFNEPIQPMDLSATCCGRPEEDTPLPLVTSPSEPVKTSALDSSLEPAGTAETRTPVRRGSLSASARRSSFPPTPSVPRLGGHRPTGVFAREVIREESLHALSLPYAYVICAVPMYECSLVPTAFHTTQARHKAVSLNMANPLSRQTFGVGCITKVRYGGVMIIECRDAIDPVEDAAWLASLREAAAAAERSEQLKSECAAPVNGEKRLGSFLLQEAALIRKWDRCLFEHLPMTPSRRARGERLYALKARIRAKLRHQGLHVVMASTRLADRRRRRTQMILAEDLARFVESQHGSEVSLPSPGEANGRRATMTNGGTPSGAALNTSAADAAPDFNEDGDFVSEGPDNSGADTDSDVGGEEQNDKRKKKRHRKNSAPHHHNGKGKHKANKARDNSAGASGTGSVAPRPKRLRLVDPRQEEELFMRGTFRQIGGFKYLDADALMDGCSVGEVVTGVRRWVMNLINMPVKARPLCLYLQRYEGIASSLRLVSSHMRHAALQGSIDAGRVLPPTDMSFHANIAGTMSDTGSGTERGMAGGAADMNGEQFAEQIGGESAALVSAQRSAALTGSFAGASFNDAAQRTEASTMRGPTYHTFYSGPLDPTVSAVLSPEVEAMIASCRERYTPRLVMQGEEREGNSHESEGASHQGSTRAHSVVVGPSSPAISNSDRPHSVSAKSGFSSRQDQQRSLLPAAFAQGAPTGASFSIAGSFCSPTVERPDSATPQATTTIKEMLVYDSAHNSANVSFQGGNGSDVGRHKDLVSATRKPSLHNGSEEHSYLQVPGKESHHRHDPLSPEDEDIPLKDGEEAWHLADRELRALKAELEEIQFLVTNAKTELLARLEEYIQLGALFLPHTRPDQVNLSLLSMKMMRQFPHEVPVKEIHSDWIPLLMSLLTSSRDRIFCTAGYAGGRLGSTTGLDCLGNASLANDMCEANRPQGGAEEDATTYVIEPRPALPPPQCLEEVVIAPRPFRFTKNMLEALERCGMDEGISFTFTGGSLGILAGIIYYYTDYLRSKITSELSARALRRRRSRTGAAETLKDILLQGGYNCLLRRLWIWGAAPASSEKTLRGRLSAALQDAEENDGADGRGDTVMVTTAPTVLDGQSKTFGRPFRAAEAYAVFDAIANYLAMLDEVQLEERGETPEHTPARPTRRRSMLNTLRRSANRAQNEAATEMGRSTVALDGRGDAAAPLVPVFELCVASNHYYKKMMAEERAAGAAGTPSHREGDLWAASATSMQGAVDLDTGTPFPERAEAKANGKARRSAPGLGLSSSDARKQRETEKRLAALEAYYCGGEEFARREQLKSVRKFHQFLADHYERWKVKHGGKEGAAPYTKRIKVTMA